MNLKRPITALCLGSAFAWTIAGCSAGYEPASRVDVASNGLGIASIEIERTDVAGDPVLQVHGFDASNREIATLELRTGTVLYSWDEDVKPTPSLGRELSISIEGSPVFQQTTPDLVPYSLSTPNRRAAEFAGLSQVARELDAEAQITARPTRSDEVAFDEYRWVEGCGSHLGDFRSGVAVSTCCYGTYWDSSNGYTSYTTTQTTATKHVGRWRNPYGTACKATNGTSSNCTGTGCYFGPCAMGGTTVDGGSNNGIYTTTWLSPYDSNQTFCDFNNNLGGDAGVDSLPSGGSCPYTDCCNYGGGAFPC